MLMILYIYIFFLPGDMIQTALSVGRNCGMVHPSDRVIIVHGFPPDKENPTARIEFEQAEAAEDLEVVDDESEQSEVRQLIMIGVTALCRESTSTMMCVAINACCV